MIDPELFAARLSARCFSNGDGGRINPMVFADPRAILPLKDFHVHTRCGVSCRKKLLKRRWTTRFRRSSKSGAKREDTWINLEIIESYTRLHELGSAHSVEAWKEGTPAGGLYGVAVGGAFFWRINVPPRHGCIEDRAGGAGRTFARGKNSRCSTRNGLLPNPAAIWRHRNFHETITCASCVEQWNCHAAFEFTLRACLRLESSQAALRATHMGYKPRGGMELLGKAT